MARSRSGTRGRRGPRKPPRRDGAFAPGAVQVIDPVERGADRAAGRRSPSRSSRSCSAVSPADIIRELIKSGIFATINQLIDRDTASLVASELGYEVAEATAAGPTADEEDGAGAPAEARQGGPVRGGRRGRPRRRAPRS